MEYEKFYKDYCKYKDKQHQQKTRGLNDYNVFTSLLSHSDEVRLHSRFIYSLLNPQGDHYQGHLFLELFFESVGIPDGFDINLTSAKVFKEHKNIDLYITDGYKHIIIENKVFAGDQKGQIARYINLIDSPPEDIYFIYLSLDRDVPSSQSIAGYKITDNRWLVKDGCTEKIHFKAVHYNNHIRKWIDNVSLEVANLSNLYQIVLQYQQVIEKLYNEYKEKCIMLSDFIGDDINKWRMLDELANERDKLLFEGLNKIAQRLFSHIKKDLKNNSAIERCEVLGKSKNNNIKFYSNRMYFRLYLTNKVILQLEYSLNLRLLLVEVAFYHTLKNKNKKSIQYEPTIPTHLGNTPAELFCDRDLQKKWIDNHDKLFIDQLDELIDANINVT